MVPKELFLFIVHQKFSSFFFFSISTAKILKCTTEPVDKLFATEGWLLFGELRYCSFSAVSNESGKGNWALARETRAQKVCLQQVSLRRRLEENCDFPTDSFTSSNISFFFLLYRYSLKKKVLSMANKGKTRRNGMSCFNYFPFQLNWKVITIKMLMYDRKWPYIRYVRRKRAYVSNVPNVCLWKRQFSTVFWFFFELALTNKEVQIAIKENLPSVSNIYYLYTSRLNIFFLALPHPILFAILINRFSLQGLAHCVHYNFLSWNFPLSR